MPSERNRTAERTRPPQERNNKLNIVELQLMNIADQHELAKKLGVPDFHALRKQELIFGILKAQTERSGNFPCPL